MTIFYQRKTAAYLERSTCAVVRPQHATHDILTSMNVPQPINPFGLPVSVFRMPKQCPLFVEHVLSSSSGSSVKSCANITHQLLNNQSQRNRKPKRFTDSGVCSTSLRFSSNTKCANIVSYCRSLIAVYRYGKTYRSAEPNNIFDKIQYPTI